MALQVPFLCSQQKTTMQAYLAPWETNVEQLQRHASLEQTQLCKRLQKEEANS